MMFGGPLMIVGLSVVGWAMLWSRPHYGFAATFAVGMFLYNVAVNALYVGPAHLQFLGWSSLFAVAVSLVFLAVGSAVVAIRKWTNGRVAMESPAWSGRTA